MGDPLLLYPMVLRIGTPGGVVDFGYLAPDLDAVTLEDAPAGGFDRLLKETGVTPKQKECPEEDEESGDGESPAPPTPPGRRLRITTGPSNALEYAQARHLRALRVGSIVQVTENYTDRYALTVWTNLLVVSPPEVPHWGGGDGQEYCSVRLELLQYDGGTA